MPTYAYACTECDNRFEIVQSFTDDSLTVCPQCEGRLRKVFNNVGVVFKGSGFYRNDSRPQKSGSSESGGSDSSPSKSSTESGSTTSSSSSSTSDSGSSGGTKPTSSGSTSTKPDKKSAVA